MAMIDTRTIEASEVTKVFDFGDDCGIFKFANGACIIGNEDDGCIFPLSNAVRGENAVDNLKARWAA